MSNNADAAARSGRQAALLAGEDCCEVGQQIDTLIASLQGCEQALALTAEAGSQADLVFIDDYSRYVDDLRHHVEALTTSPVRDLAARYSATLKLAILILLRIREIQGNHRAARRPTRASPA